MSARILMVNINLTNVNRKKARGRTGKGLDIPAAFLIFVKTQKEKVMNFVTSNSLVDSVVRPGEPLRLDGVTFYKRMGRVCAQPSKRPACSGKNWELTEMRSISRLRFTAMRSVTEYVLEVYGDLPVWREGARRYAPRLTAGNYAHRVLAPYFDERGRVCDFENFRASVGEVTPAAGMSCEYADGRVTLRWDAGRSAAGARPTDRLHVVHVSESSPGHIGRAWTLTATRADGFAAFDVPLRPGERLHVYPFFSTEDLSGFSPSRHFAVEGGPEAAGGGAEPPGGAAAGAVGAGAADEAALPGGGGGGPAPAESGAAEAVAAGGVGAVGEVSREGAVDARADEGTEARGAAAEAEGGAAGGTAAARDGAEVSALAAADGGGATGGGGGGSAAVCVGVPGGERAVASAAVVAVSPPEEAAAREAERRRKERAREARRRERDTPRFSLNALASLRRGEG